MRAALFLIIAHVYCAFAEPEIGPCFVDTGDCPSENVEFWLYSKETRDSPVLLDPLDLNPSDFEPPRPIDILIHGFTGNRDATPNSNVRPALLDHEDVYVISVDYGPLAPAPCYPQAVENLPLVSKCLAQLINNLLDRGISQSDQLHIIGFSLGGHVAGQTANYVTEKLHHITGLDPAKPGFITKPDTERLDPSDAKLVDGIHTDVLAFGMLGSLGHVDFYPNYGAAQPGCLLENPFTCNHNRAPIYYAESIYSEKGFWGRQCIDGLVGLLDPCSEDTPEALMGYHVSRDARGDYFLRTASDDPYALGRDSGENNVIGGTLQDITGIL
ncbi:pancreatic lipase-related protein 2-like [Scaptodrosophila lebanonensis]|uniref:Pancreatic lipase-related protein 2-like n=1 Tax=Drosophila lebanonensis TaxID=7225 RepID=A0A6J2U8T2_DROLE|nr:pancreatic lipase-related protein 2-like [Scaptodrosophila lebanonensis]